MIVKSGVPGGIIKLGLVGAPTVNRPASCTGRLLEYVNLIPDSSTTPV